MAALPENTQMSPINDSDPQETREWQEALTGVIDKEGADRAHFLIEQMIAQAREEGIDIPYSATTEYLSLIHILCIRDSRHPGRHRQCGGSLRRAIGGLHL